MQAAKVGANQGRLDRTKQGGVYTKCGSDWSSAKITEHYPGNICVLSLSYLFSYLAYLYSRFEYPCLTFHICSNLPCLLARETFLELNCTQNRLLFFGGEGGGLIPMIAIQKHLTMLQKQQTSVQCSPCLATKTPLEGTNMGGGGYIF